MSFAIRSSPLRRERSLASINRTLDSLACVQQEEWHLKSQLSFTKTNIAQIPKLEEPLDLKAVIILRSRQKRTVEPDRAMNRRVQARH